MGRSAGGASVAQLSNAGFWWKTKRSGPYSVLCWNRFSLSIARHAGPTPKAFLPEGFAKVLIYLLGVIFSATVTPLRVRIGGLFSRSIHHLGSELRAGELLEPCDFHLVGEEVHKTHLDGFSVESP